MIYFYNEPVVISRDLFIVIFAFFITLIFFIFNLYLLTIISTSNVLIAIQFLF